jgi:hypothetical protein
MTTMSLPKKVEVLSVVRSRYVGGGRPKSWDSRKEGIDVVAVDGGEQIRLWSDGGQSTPRHGWVLMLTEGNSQDGFRWTLYGLAKGAAF